jgi:hypothetical protein
MSDRSPAVPPSSFGESRPGGDRLASAPAAAGIEHLDFGVRNTLLYYKDLKATLDLSPGSAASGRVVARLLGSERATLSELFDADADALRSAVKRVRSISYRARRDVEKGGPGTVCIAWGMATWGNGRATVPAAPIVLRQASVDRPAAAVEDFDLVLNGPWNLNVTLLRLLEFDFGVDVERDALGDLVDELSRHGDPEALFERVAKMAADVPGFSIEPRVVLTPVPRAAMVVHYEVASAHGLQPDTAGDPIEEKAGETTSPNTTALNTTAPNPTEKAKRDVVALFVDGVLHPAQVDEDDQRVLEQIGPEAVIAEITAALHGDGWPDALIEHAASGLRVRDQAELLYRWYEASAHRPRPSGWDVTHFALWGLTSAPTAGTPAIRAVAHWRERRRHPVLVAWQEVADRRSKVRRRHGRGRKASSRAPRVAIPRGMEQALWGLPVDLLGEWAVWVFRQWPGAPLDLILPAGTPELVSAWYERARPVAELAIKTWVPFAVMEEDLNQSATRWAEQLAGACGGRGAPLGSWFEASMAVAKEAMALQLGDGTMAGALRGRRTRGGASAAHAHHAI